MKPIGDKILVKPLAPKGQTEAGLYIPETAQEKPQEGVVVAIGTGKPDFTFTVKEGDKVLFARYRGSDFELSGERLLIMQEDDVLGILE